MAGSNAIASGSAILTANADGLKTGLDRAANDVKGWGKKVGGEMGGGGGGGGGGGIGGLFAGLGKAGPIGLAIAASVGVAVLGVKELIGSFMDLEDHLGKMEDFADNVGMSMEGFSSLTHAADVAGVEMAALESGLQRFRLKVDGPLDAALVNFANSIEDIQDPGERARALFDAFGKSGVRMGKMFEGGAEGLKKMQDEAVALGIAVTKEQAEQVGSAGDAINNVKNAFKGVFQQFMIGAAPMLEFFSTGLRKAISFVKPVFDLVAGGAARVWRGVQSVFDGIGAIASRLWARIQPRVQPVFDWLVQGWETVKRIAGIAWDGIVSLVVPAVEEIIGWVEQAIDMIAGWAAEVFQFGSEWPSAEALVIQAFRMMGTAGAYAWDTIKAGAGLVAIAIGKVLGFVGDLADRFKGTFKGIADAGANAAAALGMNDTAAMFGRVGAAADRIGGSIRGAGEAMQTWGAGAFNGIGKSADQFNAWLDNALKPKEAAAEIADDLAEAMSEMAPIKLSGAISKGSKEAYGLIVKNQLRGFESRDEPVKNLVKEAKKGNDLQKKGNRDLGKMADKLDALEAI